MDSRRHDLRDALDELRPEAIQATVAVAAEEKSHGDIKGVAQSAGPPPPTKTSCDTVGAAPRCTTVASTVPETTGRSTSSCARAYARHAPRRSQTTKRGEVVNKITTSKGIVTSRTGLRRRVPKLLNEMQLLAWTHRGKSPFIHTIATSQRDADGSDIRVDMIPRSFWDEDPRFVEIYSDTAKKKQLRQI